MIGKRDIPVGGQKNGVLLRDVVVRVRQLEIVDVEIQAAEHDPDFLIQRLARSDGSVVLGRDGALVGRVRAADAGDGFRGQLSLDAGFAQDEDFALRGREREDAGDVDGGRVGGGEDVVLGRSAGENSVWSVAAEAEWTIQTHTMLAGIPIDSSFFT